MKTPNKSGDPVAETAALCVKPSQTKPDVLGEAVKQLRQRARFYFSRYQTTGKHSDSMSAAILQSALVGLLEARRQ